MAVAAGLNSSDPTQSPYIVSAFRRTQAQVEGRLNAGPGPARAGHYVLEFSCGRIRSNATSGYCRLVVGLLVLSLAGTVRAQEPATPGSITPEQVAGAIDKLGDLDFATRAKAAQTVRRAPPPVAVTALLRAIDEHKDGYVRFRAMVLLSGFNDPRASDVALRAIDDPNDRLREVAYSWFEAHPDPKLAPRLLKKLETELADFVRPALIRALAALGSVPAVQKQLVGDAFKGQDFFRSVVIEALGDYRAVYAVPSLIQIVNLEGPLRDDTALALGRIGDPRVVPVLAELQRAATRDEQPLVAAAICLTGRNCESHRGFIVKTLAFAMKELGFQELVRTSATALGALSERGDEAAFQALVEAGVPAQDPQRSPVALALGRVAIRNPEFVLQQLPRVSNEDGAVLLLRDAFDMLEEDFGEEHFFVTVRRAYWKAPEGSAVRRTGNKLIAALGF